MLEYIQMTAVAFVVFKVTLLGLLHYMEHRRWWASYEMAAIIPMMIVGVIVSLVVAGGTVWLLS